MSHNPWNADSMSLVDKAAAFDRARDLMGEYLGAWFTNQEQGGDSIDYDALVSYTLSKLRDVLHARQTCIGCGAMQGAAHFGECNMQGIYGVGDQFVPDAAPDPVRPSVPVYFDDDEF